MPYYLVEFTRVSNDSKREVIARYEWPTAVLAEVALAEMDEDAIIGELKRRWRSGGG